MVKGMTQAELQHIEHCNKILKEHQETIRIVTEETERMMSNYLENLQNYMRGVIRVRIEMGKEVNQILQSTRQISLVTSNSQKIIDFTQAVLKLEAALVPSLVDKLERLVAK